MMRVRLRDFAIALIPIVGWFFAVALLLDAGASEERLAPVDPPTPRPPAPLSARLPALAIDASLALIPVLLLSPALGWSCAASYWVFRDGGPHPIGLGKRALGLRVEAFGLPLSYRASLLRNGLVLFPYVGALVEGLLVVSGRARLGDRWAESTVVVAR